MMAVRLKVVFFHFLFIVILLSSTATASWVEAWTYYRYNFTSSITVSPSSKAVPLVPDAKFVKDDDIPFYIFCFPNVSKSVFQIWRSVQLVLLDIPQKYDIFHGVNESEVDENYRSQSFWPRNLLFPSTDAVIDFPAFSDYCVGIASTERYSFFFNVRTINYWKVLQTVLGIFIFLSSPDLSRNSFFHYASGISFGVVASLLIVLYVLSRFIPKKSASYAVLVFGYSFVLYFLKMIWHHLNDIVNEYMDIVLGYCFVTAFISFMVCYRIGPVQNTRTHNIIQWSMQALSLVLIFFSSEYRELSTALILGLLTVRLIPARWLKWIRNLWYRCFPPRIKFLSELEYIEQGHKETRKALENLRQFCKSPDCNTWKVVRKLKDPARFATFIESGSHYTDEELLDYNSEDFNEYPDDDDDDMYLEGNTDF